MPIVRPVAVVTLPLVLIWMGSLESPLAAQESQTRPQEQTPDDAIRGDDPEAEEAEESEGSRRRRRRRNRRDTKLSVDDKEVVVSFGLSGSDDRGFAQINAAQPGEVVLLTRSAAIKLKAGVDLQFGDTLIEEGNIIEGYAGVYSLWLKKVDDGWHLVFNEKPDVWGTQHDPATDVAEIPIELGVRDTEAEKLTVELVEVEANQALLKIGWGFHEWTTEFSIP